MTENILEILDLRYIHIQISWTKKKTMETTEVFELDPYGIKLTSEWNFRTDYSRSILLRSKVMCHDCVKTITQNFKQRSIVSLHLILFRLIEVY